MIATILNVAQNGDSGVLVSFSITDDNGNILDFSDQFEGTTCINMGFPIPLTLTALQDLESNINSAILTRLQTEFTKLNTTSVGSSLLLKLQKDLVGTTQSTTSITIGPITLGPNGTIS